MTFIFYKNFILIHIIYIIIFIHDNSLEKEMNDLLASWVS